MIFQILSWIPWPSCLIFVSGILCTALVQGLLVYYYFLQNSPNHASLSNVPVIDAYTFPQQLLEIIQEKLGSGTSEGTVLLNLLFQFWFHENRYNTNTLAAIGNKLNTELTELLTNTSLGKIFSSLQVHDIELGSESPTISSISLKHVNMNEQTQTLNGFVFEFDINYVGGFCMSFDSVMKFNSNSAYVSVKVAKCIGKVRVEFTRIPYTYWCMSFVTTPELELNVESRLEGHSVPQLSRVIGIQLRRRINKKFVMPYYKIRSKPFLPTCTATDLKDDTAIGGQNGTLFITVLASSRLPHQEGKISCSLIIDHSEIKDQSVTSYSHLLQLFKRSPKDTGSLVDNRKLSTGSAFQDRQDGLRQRFRSITGQDDSTLDEVRRKSFADSIAFQLKVGSEDNLQNNHSIPGSNNIQHTKRVPYSEIITFNENFKFTINSSQRFLNMLVWKHLENGNTSNTLIGYVSIPLATQIFPPGIGKKCRIFYLNPPNRGRGKSAVMHPSLSTHPGFNQSLCYGDITVAFKFVSSVDFSMTSTPVEPLSPSKAVSKDPILLEADASLSDIDSELIMSMHQFEKISIIKPIGCEFCLKKIWLKEASRCTKCNYTCHKKCVAKSEKSLECRSGVGTAGDSPPVAEEALDMLSCMQTLTNPEIIMTSPDNNVTATTRNKFTTFLANVKGVRRVGSVSNLAPPHVVADDSVTQSYSLPQTPTPSRKTSVSCDITLFDNIATEDEVEKALSYLMTMPQDEQILETIKNSGRKLCIDLQPIERETRINEMIVKIKSMVDVESKMCRELQGQQKVSSDNPESAKLAFQIGKSEERLQALTNLLLHCCSGLQDNTDTTTSSFST